MSVLDPEEKRTSDFGGRNRVIENFFVVRSGGDDNGRADEKWSFLRFSCCAKGGEESRESEVEEKTNRS